MTDKPQVTRMDIEGALYDELYKKEHGRLYSEAVIAACEMALRWIKAEVPQPRQQQINNPDLYAPYRSVTENAPTPDDLREQHRTNLYWWNKED